MSLAEPAIPEESRLVDVGAGVPLAKDYWFLGVAGAVTLVGFWMNIRGRKVQGSKSFTITIPQATGSAIPVSIQSATALPAPVGAVGAMVRLNGDVYFSIEEEAKPPDDLKTEYDQYPKIPLSDCVGIGRVSA